MLTPHKLARLGYWQGRTDARRGSRRNALLMRLSFVWRGMDPVSRRLWEYAYRRGREDFVRVAR
jgi:hypothetical protein